MKFDINEYKGNFVMHCKTKREAESFCDYLHSLGKRWHGNCLPYNTNNNWNYYKENTCYNFNCGTYHNYKYFKEKQYIILEWEDYMDHTFTKEELKSGDVLTNRNGERGMYIKEYDTIIYFGNEKEEGFIPLSEYNPKTLKDKLCPDWDIVKVQRASVSAHLVPSRWNDLKVIWEEEVPVEEMTLEEVCKALGKEIKIVKSK